MRMAIDPVDPRIQYCFPQSTSPSTALGVFDGYSFYLYARFDYVTFTISRTSGIEAEDIGELADYNLDAVQADDRLKFPEEWAAAYRECFHVEQELEKGEYEGSYMTETRKAEFIRMWCQEFDSVGRCEFKRLGPRIDWGNIQQSGSSEPPSRSAGL